MKIPAGMSFVIGRREYREGMELPAGAPQAVVKRIEKWYADQKDAAAKKGGTAPSPAGTTGEKPSEGGKL